MSIKGEPTIFGENMFEVHIPGHGVYYFTECSEISVELGEIVVHQGGRALPIKRAGLKPEFAALTLKNPQSDDFSSYNWFEDVYDLVKRRGKSPDKYKRNIALYVLDEHFKPTVEFKIKGAFPVSYKVGPFNGSTKDKALGYETKIVYDDYEMILK